MSSRCFQVLGVREGASRQEIEEAYKKKVRIYHAADYDDDPEYVAMKLSDLKKAYNEATGMSPMSREPVKIKSIKNLREMAKNFENKKSEEEYPDSEYTPNEYADSEYTASETLGDTGYVTIENPTASRSRGNGNTAGKTVTTIISVVIAIAGLGMTFFGNNSSSYDDSYDDSYDSNYSYYMSDYGYGEDSYEDYDYLSDQDIAIHNEAMEMQALVDTLSDSNELQIDEIDVTSQVDAFVYSLAGFDTMEEAIDDLYYRYDDFYYSSDDDKVSILREYLAFYGFPSPAYVEMKISPYTGEVIDDMYEYMNFIQSFHDEYTAKQLAQTT